MSVSAVIVFVFVFVFIWWLAEEDGDDNHSCKASTRGKAATAWLV